MRSSRRSASHLEPGPYECVVAASAEVPSGVHLRESAPCVVDAGGKHTSVRRCVDAVHAVGLVLQQVGGRSAAISRLGLSVARLGG